MFHELKMEPNTQGYIRSILPCLNPYIAGQSHLLNLFMSPGLYFMNLWMVYLKRDIRKLP